MNSPITGGDPEGFRSLLTRNVVINIAIVVYNIGNMSEITPIVTRLFERNRKMLYERTILSSPTLQMALWLVFTVAFIVIVYLIAFGDIAEPKDSEGRTLPPKVPGIPILGSALEYKKDPTGFFEKCRQKVFDFNVNLNSTEEFLELDSQG